MKGARNGDKVLVSALLERYGADCSYCAAHIDLERSWPDPQSVSIDHTMPISRGGEHSMKNTTLMHLICNQMEADRV